MADAAEYPPGVYEATGKTLDAAAVKATRKIPLRPHTDFRTSRVIEWGVQSGGITDQDVFYVKVIEEYADAKGSGD
jgi:hypothetical protein